MPGRSRKPTAEKKGRKLPVKKECSRRAPAGEDTPPTGGSLSIQGKCSPPVRRRTKEKPAASASRGAEAIPATRERRSRRAYRPRSGKMRADLPPAASGGQGTRHATATPAATRDKGEYGGRRGGRGARPSHPLPPAAQATTPGCRVEAAIQRKRKREKGKGKLLLSRRAGDHAPMPGRSRKPTAEKKALPVWKEPARRGKFPCRERNSPPVRGRTKEKPAASASRGAEAIPATRERRSRRAYHPRSGKMRADLPPAASGGQGIRHATGTPATTRTGEYGGRRGCRGARPSHPLPHLCCRCP